MARSLMPHEAFLAGSHYGRFFSRTVNLSLLTRRPDDWRRSQIQVAPQPPPAPAPQGTDPPKKKRKREGDEIDELFASSKKGKGTGTVQKSAKREVEKMETQEELVDDSVLRAIRAAPSEGPGARKGGKKR